jgi:hypothetical protein
MYILMHVVKISVVAVRISYENMKLIELLQRRAGKWLVFSNESQKTGTP